MPRRNPPAKWVLPSEVDPAGRKCIQIQVPDNPAHIAAFRGALLALASAYNWQDDVAHTAKDVALVWRQILDNSLEWGCGLQTQIRVDDICTLSWSYDDWVTFDSYDPSACIQANIDNIVPGMIQQAILDAIADGTLARNGQQQSPTAPPSAGTCVTYHAVLAPGSEWMAPAPVQDGSSIYVHNVKGGWSIGELAWYCGDGSRYLLGACDSILKGHVGSDLLNPGAYHMQVIGLVNSIYFSPMDAPYIVPDGTGSIDLRIMANTGLTGSPSGQVEFDVDVCEPGAWCVEFDFANGQQGWRPIHANGIDYAVFSGDHWIGIYNFLGSGGTELYVTHDGTPGTSLTEIEYYVQFLAPCTAAWAWNFSEAVACATDSTPQWISTGPFTRTSSDDFRSDLWAAASGGNQILLRKIRMHGTGVNPFGYFPCSS